MVWDASSGELLVTLAGPDGNRIRHVAWDPNGTRIVTIASDDGTAMVWDVGGAESGVAGVVLYALAGHRGPVTHAAWNPSGTRIVTTSEDRTAMVWDAGYREELYTLVGHGDAVILLIFDNIIFCYNIGVVVAFQQGTV